MGLCRASCSVICCIATFLQILDLSSIDIHLSFSKLSNLIHPNILIPVKLSPNNATQMNAFCLPWMNNIAFVHHDLLHGSWVLWLESKNLVVMTFILLAGIRYIRCNDWTFWNGSFWFDFEFEDFANIFAREKKLHRIFRHLDFWRQLLPFQLYFRSNCKIKVY